MLKNFWAAIVIQGAGATCAYFMIFIVARYGGSANQGQLSTFKSFVDLTNTLLLFGMPQAIVLAINRKTVTLDALLPIIRKYFLFAFIVSSIFALVVVQQLFKLPTSTNVYLTAFCLALASAGLVFHSLTRSLLLTRTSGSFFSLITALPSGVLLILISIQVFLDSNRYEWSFAAEGLLMWGVAKVVLEKLESKKIESPSPILPLPMYALFAEASHAFLQGVIFAAQPFITIVLLKHFGADSETIGKFVIASLVIVITNAVIAMIAPILYNHWSKALHKDVLSKEVVRIIKVSVLGQIGAIPLALLLPSILPTMLGQEYEGAVLAMQICCIATLPTVFTRLLSPALQALNYACQNSISCFVRFFVATTIIVSSQYFHTDLLETAAIGWMLGEWCAMTVHMVVVAHALNWFAYPGGR